jgi:hypothetical protein
MKNYELTVSGKSARFTVRDGEDFDAGLSRGAAKLGYRGGAWRQPNGQQVTVTDSARGSSARQSYTGVCAEAAKKRRMKGNYETTIRRNGIVRYWSVYDQQWQRSHARLIADRDLATLTQGERDRIARAAGNGGAR